MKVIFIHGNGGCSPEDIWFPSVKKELERLGVAVLAPQFPDAVLARASVWLPYLKNELKADANTIIVGHSSGAIAAMRFAEENRLLGTVLVGSYHTDLGNPGEKLSGYFDKEWNWESIRSHQKWIIQFASTDDPWIPIEEPRFVRDMLQSEYYEYGDKGHFGGDYDKVEFPELVEALRKKIAPNR